MSIEGNFFIHASQSSTTPRLEAGRIGNAVLDGDVIEDLRRLVLIPGSRAHNRLCCEIFVIAAAN